MPTLEGEPAEFRRSEPPPLPFHVHAKSPNPSDLQAPASR